MEKQTKEGWPFTIFAVCLGIVLIIPVFLIIACYWIYKKIAYRGAPQGCCRSGCSSCPWGNSKLKQYREPYLEAAESYRQKDPAFRAGRPFITKSGQFGFERFKRLFEKNE